MIKKIALLFSFLLFPTTAFASFSDVTNNTPYADSIQWTVDMGITQGYGNGNWGPDVCVTRAELLKMMVEFEFAATHEFETVAKNLTGGSGFSDVKSGDWFYDYVRYSKSNGVINGYEDGTFKPNKCVNRVESMKIAVNSMLPNEELTQDSSPLYYDDKIISDMSGTEWYAKYARFLFQKRLVGTYHTLYDDEVGKVGGSYSIKFFPEEAMTRKEVAYMMHQIHLEFPTLGD